MIIAKIALGLASTVAFATVYTMREGLITVQVDEYREGGSHVHLYVPAAAVPMAAHFAPRDKMDQAAEHLQEWLPTARQLAKELEKYPNAEFVDVQDGKDHVQIGTHNGKLRIDVREPGEEAHIACPIETIDDLIGQLGSNRPGA
jgi:hypothetical protein